VPTEPAATDPTTPGTPGPAGAGGDAPDVDTGAARGTRFVFIDTEATGLDHRRHELTEVSWIVRFEDGREEERRYFPTHTTDGADDDALELTHYEDRIAPQEKTPASQWLTELPRGREGRGAGRGGARLRREAPRARCATSSASSRPGTTTCSTSRPSRCRSSPPAPRPRAASPRPVRRSASRTTRTRRTARSTTPSRRCGSSTPPSGSWSPSCCARRATGVDPLPPPVPRDGLRRSRTELGCPEGEVVGDPLQLRGTGRRVGWRWELQHPGPAPAP
jgi:hypothetical protein